MSDCLLWLSGCCGKLLESATCDGKLSNRFDGVFPDGASSDFESVDLRPLEGPAVAGRPRPGRVAGAANDFG